MLPLPNKKLGDPSRSFSHFHGDNKIASSLLGSGCDNSGTEEKMNLSAYLIHENVDAFPKNPCEKSPYSVEERNFAPSDAIGGVINESIELIAFLDHQNASEPTPLSPANHLHSNEHYRSTGVATNPMNLNMHHDQPTFPSFFLQLERIRALDPHAFEPTPLNPNHLHSNEQYRRSSGAATDLMDLNRHHQRPTMTTNILQPLSTQLDNDQGQTNVTLSTTSSATQICHSPTTTLWAMT
jgi:hypothetical protein